MGGSGNWIKSLIVKKSAKIKDHMSLNLWVLLCFCSLFWRVLIWFLPCVLEDSGCNGKRKLRLWRSSSGGSRLILKNVAASKASDSSVVPGDGYSAVVTYLISNLQTNP